MSTIAPPMVPEGFGEKLAKLTWPGAEGWQFWTWGDHKIHYIQRGENTDKPALVLIHGFGASAFHWRYNIPELSQKYRVFALDLLGFGLSDKPLLDEYSPDVWRDQVLSFVDEVVKGPAVVAGNSLGGYTALYSAYTSPERIKGCCLLNAAGSFDSEGGGTAALDSEADATAAGGAGRVAATGESIGEAFRKWVQRQILSISFYYTKQPARIAQVLRQVYSVDTMNVDDDLVESIRFPSDHPNACEVFYKVVTRNGRGGGKTFDTLLAQLKVPLLLLWGEKDPWIRPAAADAIQRLHPQSQRVNVDAGHCPQASDEAPAAVNKAILEWMESSVLHV
ncbi:unnamed protein product [Phaeothamnion confervicola]